MPVVAQGCKPKPVASAGPAQTMDAPRTVRTFTSEYDEYSLDPASLQGAINEAQKTRALQTANAAAFLASIGESGRHKFAGTNIKIGSGTNAVSGYVTEKGLFKQWASDNLMDSASGKYGCPAKTATIETKQGYAIPSNRNQNYVGAALNASDNSNDPLFLGTQNGSITGAAWNRSERTLPACGNEGSNVQVVYPAKATGSSYRGTFNLGVVSTTKMEEQTDMSVISYETCMKRAEDKGRSVFGLTGNKCYIGSGTLGDAQSAGIAYAIEGTLLGPPAEYTQKLFHFGMDGTLNILKTSTPSNNEADVTLLGYFGQRVSGGFQGTSAKFPNGVDKCDFKTGGLLAEKPTGTWGENCNEILEPYLRDTYWGYW
jgi:hypothetical protein